MNDTVDKQNVLPEIMKPTVLYPFIALLVVLIVSLFLMLYKVKIPKTTTSTSSGTKSQEEIIGTSFIIIFFILLVIGVCFTLMPNFKDVGKLFQQISNVTLAIIYTIFIIALFTLMKPETINKYAYFLTPITILVGLFTFYKATTQNLVDEFNVNYERIKMMILFLCLLTVIIVYYNIDPGGYIKEYFGYSLLLTIITAAFGLVYLITLLTMGDKKNESTSPDKPNNLLDNFSGFASYGSIGFILFIISITIIIQTLPTDFLTKPTYSGPILMLILIISILWLLLIVSSGKIFPEIVDNSGAINKLNTFRHSLLILFGIVISGLLIAFIVYNIKHLTDNTGTTTFVLNLLLILSILGLIYKTIHVTTPTGNAKKNTFFSLFVNVLFYIPSLFNDVVGFIGAKMTSSGSQEKTPISSFITIAVIISLFILLFYVPTILHKFNLQGGTQLVNRPVHTDTLYTLGTYEELTGTDDYEYQYAISCWVYLDSFPPNTTPAYNKYTSLLNFGGKPNLLYNSSSNSFLITVKQDGFHEKTSAKLTDFDEDNNRILYKHDKVLLQKWNNIIINYNGGTMDIFLNGELVKSNIGVVPYYTLDKLTIGQENGINGGICNVTYFNKALNSLNIYYLYNMVKNKSPPVINDSNETIIKIA